MFVILVRFALKKRIVRALLHCSHMAGQIEHSTYPSPCRIAICSKQIPPICPEEIDVQVNLGNGEMRYRMKKLTTT